MSSVNNIMTEIEKIQQAERISTYDRMHLKMISLMHDGIYSLYVDPHNLLKAAGLRSGQNVLEVGCGPGYFTVAAAEIVGGNGFLHSIDINPAAVQHVRQKVEEKGLKNVEVTRANVSKTALAQESIDLAFLFGIVHSLKDIDSVLSEMYRILKPGGELVVQKSSWSESNLLKSFTKGSLFQFVEKDSRIYKFKKGDLEKPKDVCFSERNV